MRDPARLGTVDGDFAAALVDERTGALLLARDPMGICALYYVHRPGEFVAFCSLALPLVHAGYAGDTPDVVSALNLQLWDFDLGTRTYLRDVNRVPEAHVLRIDAHGVTAHRYHRPAPSERVPSDADPAALADRMRAILDRAVRKRLPAIGAVAAHCSGGLDSSSVTVLAAEALEGEGRRVQASFVHPPRRSDVRPIEGSAHVAAVVQRHPGIDLVRIEKPAFSDTAGCRFRADLPAPDDWAGNQWSMTLEAAGRAGIPVLLSGFGGNETASHDGEAGITDALLRFDFRSLGELLSASSERRQRPRGLVLAAEIARRVLPGKLYQRLRPNREKSPGVYETLMDFLTPEGRRFVRLPLKPWTSAGHRILKLTDGRIALSAEAAYAFGAKFGVAVAYPFLDRDVIAFTLSVPARFFVREGVTRWLLRGAMKGRLPEMIRTARDGLPVDGTFLVSMAESRDTMLAEVDRMMGTTAARYFDLPALRAAIEKMPPPEEFRDEINALAEAGRLPVRREVQLSYPYTMARFLARNELAGH